jgi:hypothetical protein
MKKLFVAAALALALGTGAAWGYNGWSTEGAEAAMPPPDPYTSAAAQHHFACQPTHWISLVLMPH